MKLKLREVAMVLSALSQISNMRFKAKTSYKIARNINKLDLEVKLLEKQRLQLVEEYCERDNEGRPVIEGDRYKIKPEKQLKFQEEYEKLLDEEVDVDLMEIDLDELESCEISPSTLINIMPVIKEKKSEQN